MSDMDASSTTGATSALGAASTMATRATRPQRVSHTPTRRQCPACALGAALALLTPTAFADSHAVSDCTASSVQSAVDAAADGDEVFLDCDGAAWATAVTIAKGITLRGKGPDATILQADNSTLLDIDVPSGAFRLTGLGFTGTLPQYGAAITIDGQFSSFRVDHCSFTNINDRSIILGYYGTEQPAIRGVLDHITFATNTGRSFMLQYGQDDAWNMPDDYGSESALFIEDSTFTWDGDGSVVCDGEHGARFVVRNNTITNGILGWHDTGSTPGSRSTRKFEIYDNLFQCTKEDCGWAPIGFRGGTGVVYRNTIPLYPGGYENPSASEIYRVSYPAGGDPWPNACDSVVDRVCSDFHSHCSGGDRRACGGDYDCPDIGTCVGPCASDTDCGAGVTCLEKLDGQLDALGWPCRDQTGRGQDDPVTHEQPNSPVYWWSNRGPAAARLSVYIAEVNQDYIKPNRDYFEEVDGFDGSAGVGVGPSGSRPATCTPDTGYWDTDQNVLFRCSASGTWEQHYTPFPYPHPLNVYEPDLASEEDGGGCACSTPGRTNFPGLGFIGGALGTLVLAARRRRQS